MNCDPMRSTRITISQIRHWTGPAKLVALTAYDYPMARLLDEAGVDILHVGDSLGMVVLGLPDTRSVTLDDMVRATGAVARARRRALITADLPAGTYDEEKSAVRSATRLIEAGADAVKLEGGADILAQVRALVAEGIEVQGHVGLMPQRVQPGGAYRRQGRTEEEAARILRDAQALEEAGVFSLVIEAVVSSVAERVAQACQIPVLGIGSGANLDGQIRVSHDVLGFTPWYVPGFIKENLGLGEKVTTGVREFCRRVRRGEEG